MFIEAAVSLPRFRRGIWLEERELRAFICRYGPRGLYATVWRYPTKDPYGPKCAPFYADFDGDWPRVRNDVLMVVRALEVLYRVPPQQIRLYFSGNKGIHLEVPAEVAGTDEPDETWPMKFRWAGEHLASVAELGTLDLKVYEGRRLWRLPYTQHEKTGLFKIPVSLQEIQAGDIEAIRRRAQCPDFSWRWPPPSGRADMGRLFTPPKRAAPVHRYPPKLDFRPPCIHAMLTGSVPKGSRHDTLLALTSYLIARGISEAKALEILTAWNEAHCEPPIPEGELHYQIRYIYQKGGYALGCNTLDRIAGGGCRVDRCPLGQLRQRGRGPGLAGGSLSREAHPSPDPAAGRGRGSASEARLLRPADRLAVVR